jgi:hypothetical protein
MLHVSPAHQARFRHHDSPQAIIMVSSGAPAAAFIEQYRASGGSAQLFASSEADIEQLAKRLGKEQIQAVAIAQVTPSPYWISSRLAKELNDAVERAGKMVPVSFAMMEGFIAAKVIVEAVRRQNAQVTRWGFLHASRIVWTMIFPWVMLTAAAVFGYLAYDAARLSTPAKDVPYSLTAKGWDEDVAHVSLAKQQKRKQYNATRGIGDLSQSVWLFGVLCVGCLASAGYSFYA